MISTKVIPFRLTRDPTANGRLNLASFTCECGWSDNVKIARKGDKTNNEATVKRAEDLGWNARVGSTDAECPACVKSRKAAASGDRPAPKETTPMAEFVPTALTSEKRFEIRGFLDKHFDDQKGRYLDGMTDEKIAVKCGLARFHVETVREAAYGPIKVSPEQLAIERAIAPLEKHVAEASFALESYRKRTDDLSAAIEGARVLLAAMREAAKGGA